MPKGKPQYLLKGRSTKKDKRVMIRLPQKQYEKIVPLMEKYEIKTFQELYDLLVVSGICLREPVVLDYVTKHVGKYEEESRKKRMDSLNGKKAKKEKTHAQNCTMYSSDKLALDNYVTDKNIKKSWLFKVLLCDAFISEDEKIIEYIQRLKEKDVISRKKQIARLSNDNYVETIDEETSFDILKKMTENYDKRRFSEDIQEDIIQILTGQDKKERQEEEELEDEFQKKLKYIRQKRTKAVNKIAGRAED